jgi:hypothetical protein
VARELTALPVGFGASNEVVVAIGDPGAREELQGRLAQEIGLPVSPGAGLPAGTGRGHRGRVGRGNGQVGATAGAADPSPAGPVGPVASRPLDSG